MEIYWVLEVWDGYLWSGELITGCSNRFPTQQKAEGAKGRLIWIWPDIKIRVREIHK